MIDDDGSIESEEIKSQARSSQKAEAICLKSWTRCVLIGSFPPLSFVSIGSRDNDVDCVGRSCRIRLFFSSFAHLPKNLHPPVAPLFAFSPARNIRTAVRKTIATRIGAGRTPHIRNHRAPLSEALMRGAEKGRTK